MRSARRLPVLRVTAVGMAVLGVAALTVALFVAEGEARGHAMFHLLTGVVAAGLFAVLAFLWHPRAGSDAAMFRRTELVLLAVAALGAFLESLGGSGYDAANEAHRIEALTTMHNLVTPLGALLIVAVPIGLVTGCVVLVASLMRRARGEPA